MRQEQGQNVSKERSKVRDYNSAYMVIGVLSVEAAEQALDDRHADWLLQEQMSQLSN